MPQFEVEGPCPDGDFFVVRVEMVGDEVTRTFLCESYCTAEAAQADADRFTADPRNSPTP